MYNFVSHYHSCIRLIRFSQVIKYVIVNSSSNYSVRVNNIQPTTIPLLWIEKLIKINSKMQKFPEAPDRKWCDACFVVIFSRKFGFYAGKIFVCV